MAVKNDTADMAAVFCISCLDGVCIQSIVHSEGAAGCGSGVEPVSCY